MLFVPPSIPYMVPEAAAELTIVPWGQTDYGSQWRDQPYGVAPCENPVFAGLTCPATLGDSWLHTYPVLQDMTLNITNATGIPVLFFLEPRVSDNGEDVGWTSCSSSHDSNGWAYQFMPVGTTVVTCNANDYDLIASYTITVVNTSADTTPPVLALVCCAMSGDTTENITRQATNSTGYNVGFAVYGTDNVDGNTMHTLPDGTRAISVDCSAPNVTAIGNVEWWNASGLHNSLFPVGVTTITCTATDVAGNTTTETFTVTVLAPVELTIVPFGQTYNAGQPHSDGNRAGNGATSLHPCQAQWLPVFAGVNCTYTYFDYYTDGFGGNGIFPVLQDMTLNITNATGIPNFAYAQPRVSNNGEDVGSTSCSPFPVTPLPVGTTTITCTYESLTAAYTITVVNAGDTTPPIVKLITGRYQSPDTAGPTYDWAPAENITRQATNSTGYNVGFDVIAIDDVDGYVGGIYIQGDNFGGCSAPNVTSVGSNVSGIVFQTLHNSLFPIGVTTVTCTATDAAGNTTTETFTVTVLDVDGNTTPVLSFLNVWIGSETNSGTGMQIVPDNGPNGWSNPGGITVVDGEGELTTGGTTTWAIRVHNEELTPTCNGNAPDFHATTGSVLGYWDSSPNSFWVFSQNFPVGGTTLTCTATDAAGNVGTTSLTVTITSEAATEEIVIPSWIKNNAGWWASNQIDDRSFVSGLQWLITNGIMNIPPTEQGAGSDDVIPGWIKNNAGWWADGLIDDRNFVTGLQWLITNGIMIIELE